VKYFPCPCHQNGVDEALPSASFLPGIPLPFLSIFKYKILTRLVICQLAELDLPCPLKFTFIPFENVPPASSYSVPVTSTMRSSSFSYKVLSYILIHIFFHAVRSIKSCRKISSCCWFFFIHWRAWCSSRSASLPSF